MRILHGTLLVATLAGALAVSGCSTTAGSIEQSWRSPTVQPGELRNVVTLVPSRNEVIRRNAEEKLARKLQARGVHAIPGYTILSPADLGDRSRAVTKLRRAGYDGVVTMRFLGSEETLEYYPSFDVYWGDAWGDTVPETIVRIEINAYSLDGNRLLWSALSKSVDPDDMRNLVDDVSEVASRELDKQRVVTPTVEPEASERSAGAGS